MSNLRREALYAVVDELTRVHDAWVEDHNRENPDETYWDAVDEVINTFAAGDIPAECRMLCERAGDLAKEMAIFDERGDIDNGYPQSNFWEARQRLEDARKAAVDTVIKPMESVKELHDQGVTHEQIARMYGLITSNGVPMSWLIGKYLADPNSVLELKNWRDPRIVEQEKRERDAIERAKANLQAKATAADGSGNPCKETPQELWEQGVSVAQAALMLRKKQEEVQAIFDQFERLKKAKADAGPLEEGEGDDDGDDDTDLERKVLEMARQGVPAAEIAKSLGKDGRKVAGILKRSKEAAPASA